MSLISRSNVENGLKNKDGTFCQLLSLDGYSPFSRSVAKKNFQALLLDYNRCERGTFNNIILKNQ